MAQVTVLQKLRALFTRRDKTIFGLIIGSTIVISLLEVLALSITMLFISSIINFKTIASNKYFQYLFAYTGKLTNAQIILIFGSFLIFFYLFRCTVTLIHTYFMNRFLENRKHLLTSRFFQNYLRFTYDAFANKNPSNIYKLIFNDAANITVILGSSIKIFAELFTISLIYASLIFINWKMTLALTFVLSIKVFLILKACSSKLAEQGCKVAFHNRNIGKIFNESYRNFKLVKLFSHESHLLSRLTDENKGLLRAQVFNKVLQEAPRLLLETIGFSILAGAVIYVVYRIETPEFIIPILSMYALAFYRFMPSTTRVLNAYNEMIFARGAIDLSKDLMYQTIPLGKENISFEREVVLKNVSFEYKEEAPIFTNISLSIEKKKSVALIGESGSGKSTLADIVMGFHAAQEGAMYIDGIKLTTDNLASWRKKIGYIPQQIYLFDGTVAENIAFGRPYNEKKIIATLKKANVYDFLLKEDGVKTKVGEGGILLSGGQMQRIAIARALYNDPEILVLDEATSALDNETETKIMNEIYELNNEKTLIIIAHRLSTVLKCEKIYRVENKSISLVDKNKLYKEYLSNVQHTEYNQAPPRTSSSYSRLSSGA